MIKKYGIKVLSTSGVENSVTGFYLVLCGRISTADDSGEFIDYKLLNVNSDYEFFYFSERYDVTINKSTGVISYSIKSSEIPVTYKSTITYAIYKKVAT